MKLIKVEEISIQIENKVFLKGRAYWPGVNNTPDGKKPFLILCHGLPPATVPPPVAVTEAPEEEDGGYAALAGQCTATLGIPSFHFNFRGAGESGGDFDLLGWSRDLVAFLDYWEQKRDAGQGFTLWGFSAGGAVSAYVAASDPRVRNLIMAASPAGFKEIFHRENLQELILRFRHTGIIKDPDFPPDPQQWLNNIHTVEPLSHLSRFAPRPLLLIHGSGDELIPPHHAFRLYEAAGPGKELIILPGASHQLRKEQKAVENCLRWLEKIS
jgi:fermentation-respiration switch protein FrsA (DUF1100 family)